MLTDRDDILPVDTDRIPMALKGMPRWAIWKAEPSTQKDGTLKLDKVPYQALQPHVRAKSNDSGSWSTFDEAHQAYLNREQTGADGLLFALGGGFAAVDIDESVDHVTGEPSAGARRIIADVDSYAELSVSGGGVRIFAFGPEAKGIRFGDCEVYSRYRFMTVTGRHVPGTLEAVEDRADQLDALRSRLEQERTDAARVRRLARGGGEAFSTVTSGAGGDVGPEGDAAMLGICDEEIIDTGYDIDGFADLWFGNTAAYDGDASRADLALASRLAFLCGPEQHERVRRLMEQSGLVREKWFTHTTYLMGLTIAKAYEGRTEYYGWSRLEGLGNHYERVARRLRQAVEGGPPATRNAPVCVLPAERSAGGYGDSSRAGADDRPTIVLGPETDAILRELECHMARHVYQQNGRLVRIEQCDSGPDDAVVRRPRGTRQIVTVPEEMTQRLLSRHVRFVKVEPNGRGKSRKMVTTQVAVPASLAKVFTKCGGWTNIPHLSGITSTPFIRRDGVIVSTPGFDPVSGYLFIDDGTPWEPVPDRPTDEQVLAAVDQLLDVVSDFPFEKPEHRSAWLATLLTVVARPAIYGPVPMLWVDGNRKGTGKTLLQRVTSAIACGHDPTEISYSSDEQELEKRLASVLMAGDRIASFDNATGSLRNPVLDRFLTSTIFSTRRLFAQELVKLLNNTVLTVTGNNLILRGDLSRRILRVRLVTNLERPDRRTGFRHSDLFGFVSRNRPLLFAAALTILRAHAAAGFPHPTVEVTRADRTTVCEPLRPVGSFREWDVVVRHALVRIGLPDPALTQDEVHEEDEGDTKMLTFLWLWEAWLGTDREFTVTELIKKAIDEPWVGGMSDGKAFTERAFHRDFSLALLELTETEPGKTPSAKTLGYRLRENRDRKIGGFRLVRSPGKGRDGVRYRVVKEDPAADTE